MTRDEVAWHAIAHDLPRTWEFYDASGAWFGRDTARNLDDAVQVATMWLADDARFRYLRPHTATITLRCLVTDERAKITIEIEPWPSQQDTHPL